jgi:hypothetical protein
VGGVKHHRMQALRTLCQNDGRMVKCMYVQYFFGIFDIPSWESSILDELSFANEAAGRSDRAFEDRKRQRTCSLNTVCGKNNLDDKQ